RPEDEEESAKLVALRFAETGEQLVFSVALCLRSAFELLFTSSGEGDDVPAAIGWIAFAREAAVGFERVEQRHEDAWDVLRGQESAQPAASSPRTRRRAGMS